jgi:hypothetical protein
MWREEAGGEAKVAARPCTALGSSLGTAQAVSGSLLTDLPSCFLEGSAVCTDCIIAVNVVYRVWGATCHVV